MNESVDIAGIIEVSHTKHTKKNEGDQSDEDPEIELSAEAKKHH